MSASCQSTPKQLGVKNELLRAQSCSPVPKSTTSKNPLTLIKDMFSKQKVTSPNNTENHTLDDNISPTPFVAPKSSPSQTSHRHPRFCSFPSDESTDNKKDIVNQNHNKTDETNVN
ncbi:unnamed protein product [Rotaria sordida]|uniref:Uncharacterized protein n=1 Tax=Rotaria sordida TaxID=392033 RepID=A0A815JLQ9_9BILA|nr:unnamed protein product [Rotaria sordida]CAF1494307.1 unnamed protein product [Rotaria sordida]CAF4072627.1 unnamed protein product [Rotaria sordida]